MVTETDRQHIQGPEMEEPEDLVAEDDDSPGRIVEVQAIAASSPTRSKQFDVSHQNNVGKNGQRWHSGLPSGFSGNGKNRRRNDESPLHVSVNTDLVRGAVVQAKNDIPVEKAETPQKERMDESDERQLDPDAGNASPRTKMWIEPQLVLLLSSDSIEAECFKLFQTLLSFSSSRKTRRAILITSTRRDEVLAVDCDLNQPDISGLFGIGSLPGVQDYFASGAPISSKPYATDIEGFRLTPDGDDPKPLIFYRFPSETKRMSSEWVERFDERTMILFYAPLHLPAVKPNEAVHAENVLFVIDFGVLPPKSIGELLERVGHDKILGCFSAQKKRHTKHPAQTYTFGQYGRRN